MIDKYFDKTYLINLTSNKLDRLPIVTKNCDKVNLKFTRFNAVNGNNLKNINENHELRFNKSAAGLVQTTIKILNEAIDNNYKQILILEDDIEFDIQYNTFIPKVIQELPSDFDFVFFGITHKSPPKSYSKHIVKIKSGMSCHCYGINNNIFSKYKEYLENMDRPIDFYTDLIIKENNNSYAVRPNMVYQSNGISNIEGGYLNTSFIRQF